MPWPSSPFPLPDSPWSAGASAGGIPVVEPNGVKCLYQSVVNQPEECDLSFEVRHGSQNPRPSSHRFNCASVAIRWSDLTAYGPIFIRNLGSALALLPRRGAGTSPQNR
jgi:hypothetical protein